MGRAAIEGWITLDAAKKLFAMAGQDFDALKKQALTREFKPVPLGLKASMAIKNTLRTIDSQNVVAKLEGSDPQLKDEYVVYTAHWDHLGIGAPVNGDKIYNGALDNASGVATRARDRARVHAGAAAAEAVDPLPGGHGGRAGAARLAVLRASPRSIRWRRPLANINIDGVNQWGRTKDITVIGLGASDLDDYLRDAARRAGPHAAAGSGAGEGLLLPLRSLQLREAGRAGARPGRGHRLHRQAGGLRQEEARRVHRATTTTRRRTR